jgi:hypothetical protein
MKTPFRCVTLTFFLISSLASAQWVQTNGPESGEVFCIAACGKDLFVGTENGVYRSTDDGTNWSPTELRNTMVLSLAVKPIGGSDTALFAGTWFGGMFRSTSHGGSWTDVDFGLRNNWVRTLAVSDTDIFAGTDSGGVFLSSNNGDYWIPVNEGLTNPFVNAVSAVGTNLYAATDSGLFRSTNHGTSWTLLALAGQKVNAVAVIDTILFAGTDTSGIFRSTDRGTNWTIINDPDMPAGTTAMAVISPYLFAGTGNGVFRTPNNGGYWIPVSGGMWNAGVTTLCPRGPDLFAGTYGGMFRSSDYGVHWTLATSGLKTTVVEALASRGESLYAGGRNGIFRSTDHGETWSPVADIWAPSLAIDGMKVYAGTWGHVFYSFDDGATWDPLPLGKAGGRVFALAAVGSELLAGTEKDGVLRITIPAPGVGTVTTTDLQDTAVYSLAVSGMDIFAGTKGGVFRSTNGGVNWTAVNNGLTKSEVLALAVQGANLFAGMQGGGVFRSTNRGDLWTPVDSGVSELAVQAFAISGNNLFAGTWQGGVFLSSDNGTHWTAVNTGLMTSTVEPSSVVHAFAIVGTDLYAGTRGGGVWRRPLSEMVVSVESTPDVLPNSFSLHQNYPNPFNPTTGIRYQVAALSGVEGPGVREAGSGGLGLGASNTKLVVYDLLGREVAVLVNEKKSPGTYEVHFDGSGLASGVYIYRLMAGSFVQSRTMMLLK